MQAAAPAIASPCISQCGIDPATGLCRGCGRTLDEIAAWGAASDADKRTILEAVRRRRGEPAALVRPGPA